VPEYHEDGRGIERTPILYTLVFFSDSSTFYRTRSNVRSDLRKDKKKNSLPKNTQGNYSFFELNGPDD